MNQRNMAASVRARLLNRARENRQDFNLILTRHAIERLLYGLSISPHADQFLLNGALMCIRPKGDPVHPLLSSFWSI